MKEMCNKLILVVNTNGKLGFERATQFLIRVISCEIRHFGARPTRISIQLSGGVFSGEVGLQNCICMNLAPI